MGCEKRLGRPWIYRERRAGQGRQRIGGRRGEAAGAADVVLGGRDRNPCVRVTLASSQTHTPIGCYLGLLLSTAY
jgi:hypothetical protein